MADLDDVAQYNLARWEALAAADALFTRPKLDLDPAAAHELVDSENQLGAVAGKRVLCLACGGGQQSVAFALMGAQVTVFDISAAQLERDRAAAAHYGAALSDAITVAQGDMRDLSRFDADSFDLVYHAYSLGFVPDARVVFGEVARVLVTGGIYFFHCANPFYLGMTQDDWQGTGYVLAQPYERGAAIDYTDQEWVYEQGKRPRINPAREYRHPLSTLVNGLSAHGFVLYHLADSALFDPDPAAEPGTWSHFVRHAPPWLGFWARYRPDVLG